MLYYHLPLNSAASKNDLISHKDTHFIDAMRNKAKKKKLTGCVFIDLSKAVKAISHSERLKKIPFYEIYWKTELEWFTSYPFCRSQVV